MKNTRLSHVDAMGAAKMVDISSKRKTLRVAVARGAIGMKPATLRLIERNKLAKGDVLSVARIAGIQAAKGASSLIPLCHPIGLTNVDIEFDVDPQRSRIAVTARVACRDRTGAEMEALTAVAAACLTVYDMAKAADRGMAISDIMLVEKRGGKSGTWKR
ncbi:MAG: cyclic pyranopterin monophosphate synthase MoaC [Candidatus Edwardsbacteria bacterium]|nr:cyclic pyranopterin monophosphate synthase MoaC [Candidatus Edwardsbacteria bacterium]